MDNKLRFDFTSAQAIIKKVGFIDSFKGKWINIESLESKYLKELKRIDKWMIFFLESLEETIKKLKIKYKQYKEKGPYLNNRQKEILKFIREHEPIKVKDLSTHFDSESRNTIKKDIQYFLKEGILEKIGKGRGTIYILKSDEKE